MGITEIKNEVDIAKNAVSISFIFDIKTLIDVGNLRFPSFYYVFYSIAVSSLDVLLYAYRSSADDFCSKASEPRKELRTKNSVLMPLFCSNALILLNS